MELFMADSIVPGTAPIRVKHVTYAYVHCTNIEGQYAVSLRKDKKHLFAVQYGKQHKYNLTETEAAHEYGECIMHALTCAGRLD